MDNLRRLRLLMIKRRRILAALCAGLAVLLLGQALSTGSVNVVVTAHNLASGAQLTKSDLEIRKYPPSLVPAEAFNDLDEVIGGVLTSPSTQGEPLTAARITSPQVELPAGSVLAPLRIEDPAAVVSARIGDLVNVVAVGGPESGRVIAKRVPLVSIEPQNENGFTGYLVQVAVEENVAIELASSAAQSSFSLVVIPQ